MESISLDTEPVGTIIQKSLKVPERQILLLHSQGGD